MVPRRKCAHEAVDPSSRDVNPTIKDRKLLIKAKQAFREWSWPSRVSEWCSTLNDVRTLTATNKADFAQTVASVEETIARMAGLDERVKAA
jgi:hypothetical protein